MAIEVVWTHEAASTFDHHVNYLTDEWGEQEAEKFFLLTNKAIRRIQIFPESYPPGIKSKSYRRARISKYVVMFYRYQKTKQRISIITFWHLKQDPAKLKY